MDSVCRANATDFPVAQADATTDAAGMYRFRLAPGPYRVTLSGPGRADFRRDDGQTSEELQVTGDSAPLTVPPIVLSRKPILVGRVLDSTGAPVAGATLTDRDQVTPRFETNRNLGMTDGRGEFRIVFEKQTFGRFTPAGVGDPIHVRLADGREFDAPVLANPGSAEVTVRLPGPDEPAPQAAKLAQVGLASCRWTGVRGDRAGRGRQAGRGGDGGGRDAQNGRGACGRGDRR